MREILHLESEGFRWRWITQWCASIIMIWLTNKPLCCTNIRMRLTERILLKPNHSHYKNVRKLCALTASVSNQALYYFRQNFFNHENNKWATIDKLMKLKHADKYNAIPNAISQSVIKKTGTDFDAFWKAYRQWQQHPDKFKERPVFRITKNWKRPFSQHKVFRLLMSTWFSLKNSILNPLKFVVLNSKLLWPKAIEQSSKKFAMYLTVAASGLKSCMKRIKR